MVETQYCKEPHPQIGYQHTEQSLQLQFSPRMTDLSSTLGSWAQGKYCHGKTSPQNVWLWRPLTFGRVRGCVEERDSTQNLTNPKPFPDLREPPEEAKSIGTHFRNIRCWPQPFLGAHPTTGTPVLARAILAFSFYLVSAGTPSFAVV